ncbi:MAG: hypothetical protein AB8F26_12005 [Phycisphaerales bacterium]
MEPNASQPVERSEITEGFNGAAVEASEISEPKADPLAAIAVDANALAGAMASGQGTDLSRLITDLLSGRPAA